MKPLRSLAALAAPLLLGVAIAACTPAGPTGYGPAIGLYGYSQEKLENGAWKIAFTGNGRTPRQLVENAALFRAAEFSLEQGAPTFMLIDRSYERETERNYAQRTPPARYVGEMDRHGGLMNEGGDEDARLVTTERRRATVTILPLKSQPARPGFPVEDAEAVMRRLEAVVKHRGGQAR